MNKVVAATRLKHAKTKHFAFIPVSPLQYLSRISGLNRDKILQTNSLYKIPKEVMIDSLIAKTAKEISKNELAQN